MNEWFKNNRRPAIGIILLSVLGIANIIVRFLGYGSVGTASPGPGAGPAGIPPLVAGGEQTIEVTASAQTLDNGLATLKAMHDRLGKLPAVQRLPGGSETIAIDERNLFSWATETQVVQASATPGMIEPALLGVGVARGRTTALIQVGPSAVLLREGDAVVGLPFMLTAVATGSATITYGDGRKVSIFPPRFETDRLNRIIRILQGHQSVVFYPYRLASGSAAAAQVASSPVGPNRT